MIHLTTACPVCSATAGEECFQLDPHNRKIGHKPHKARRDLAKRQAKDARRAVKAHLDLAVNGN